MALPLRSGTKRMSASLVRRQIDDPSFERPMVVYMRPLLGVEIDNADAKSDLFVARHVTGGWVNDEVKPARIEDDPEPIFIEGVQVEITDGNSVEWHRYEEMQRPLPGEASPPDQDFVSVADIVMASRTSDDFYRGLKAFGREIWASGNSGKAWGREKPKKPGSGGQPKS